VYNFEVFANDATDAEYHVRFINLSRDYSYTRALWNDKFPEFSKWSFDFLQNTGSWSWKFDVFWKKGEKSDNEFSVFFSNVAETETAPCPRGEVVTYWPKKRIRCKICNPLDGVVLWATIKVPLKVLAHQFAGNLGEK